MKILKKLIIWILTWESRLILAKYRPFIVAVTGSVGKTSTKDAIYCVLKDQSRYVRKSQKSLNSDIGLPLTIIGAPNAWHDVVGWSANVWRGLKLIIRRADYPDCLILEVGADHPGDIKKVTKWLHPDIAVVTRISRMPVHVEFFRSPEQVFEEKAALAEAVKLGGTVVLFADDEKNLSIAERLARTQPRIITFGQNEKADVRALQVMSSFTGLSFGLHLADTTVPIAVPGVIGEAYCYPILAAAAVGFSRGMTPDGIARRLNNYEAPRGRMNIIPGVNGATLIDDTYNSSPDAALSALKTLKDIACSGAKIAVLGDMMELGKYAAEEHRRIGREAATVVSLLITVGPRSRMSAEEALKHGLSTESARSFDSTAEAATFLAPIMKTGDIILVKGSQSMRMERIVKALMNEPQKADMLLVRQEQEWLDKA